MMTHMFEGWSPGLPSLLHVVLLGSQALPERGRNPLPEALKPLSWVPAGPLPLQVLCATWVGLQGLKALSSSEMEIAQVGHDNQEDNLEGYLQAP